MAIETKKRDSLSDDKMNVDNSPNPNVLIEEEENDKEQQKKFNIKNKNNFIAT